MFLLVVIIVIVVIVVIVVSVVVRFGLRCAAALRHTMITVFSLARGHDLKFSFPCEKCYVAATLYLRPDVVD